MSNHPTSGRARDRGSSAHENQAGHGHLEHLNMQHSATHSPDSTTPSHLVPALALRPANANGAGKANRGWLTTERAKALGKIGGDKFAASKRGKSILPRCVGCLLAIGWGYKRIVRHTGWAKTSVHRWAKFNGLNLRATAEQKKQAAMGQRKRKAAEKKAARLAECARKKAERAARPKKTAMDLYYANHEHSKAVGRKAALRRYYTEIKKPGSGYILRKRISTRIRNAIVNGHAIKERRTLELTGCTIEQLKTHLESQFNARMTWANYGRAWHIDHIMPCASFDLTDEAQQRQCFHFSNLRPMWAKANLRKSDTITDPQFRLLLPAS